VPLAAAGDFETDGLLLVLLTLALGTHPSWDHALLQRNRVRLMHRVPERSVPAPQSAAGYRFINLCWRYHRNMAIIAPDAEVERVELVPAAALFRSLGDPARLMIVRRLARDPARVTDLVSALGLAQSTVSKHLACLRDCGLVISEPVGRASVFRLAQPALAEVLTAAETVLAATGNAVALCPAWGLGTCGPEPS